MKQSILVVGIITIIFTSCKEETNNSAQSFNDPTQNCATVKKLNDVVMESDFSSVVAFRSYTCANVGASECIAASADINHQFGALLISGQGFTEEFTFIIPASPVISREKRPEISLMHG